MTSEEPLLFEQSVKGRRGFDPLPLDVPQIDESKLIPEHLRRSKSARLPEVSEPQVIRHFTRLSQWNYGLDQGFYPLGSCTMKYNPKVTEFGASLPGFQWIHPYSSDTRVQGALELMWRLKSYLCEISGLAATSLQPSAGAQGELTGLKIIRAAHLAKGELQRSVVLVPDSAHGTNPASCTLTGFKTRPIKSSDQGIIEPDKVRAVMDETVAGIMITNPSTLGLFEPHIGSVCEIVHKGGGYVYLDGANMNAILGQVRPSDMGVDVMHYNLHKTFGAPHGGGGPGSGPVSVIAALEPFLPNPDVIRKEDGTFAMTDAHLQSVGRVRSFFGNFLTMVRAYAYIRSHGPKDLRKISELAVLNANYLRVRLSQVLNPAFDKECMHECVFDDKTLSRNNLKTIDFAKRLIDYGYHPPTVYFPLNVRGAIMCEPTESESLNTIDQFCEAVEAIMKEAETDPELLQQAPHKAFRRRVDETRAARKPELTYPLE